MPSEDSSSVNPFGRYLKLVTKNPALLVIVTGLYAVATFGVYLYQRETERTARLEAELLHQTMLLKEQTRILDVRDVGRPLDIFRNLSFSEKSSAADREKVQAALSLNSFAEYALANKDFQKARDTLQESLRTFPTQEAQYYMGVVAYEQGDAEAAVASWQDLSKIDGSPHDILLYLAIAEYKLGNLVASMRYADRYAQARPK